jgi:hypothetical protein
MGYRGPCKPSWPVDRFRNTDRLDATAAMTWPIGALEPDAGSRRSCHKADSPFNVRYACAGNVYANEVDRAAKIVSGLPTFFASAFFVHLSRFFPSRFEWKEG